MLYDQIRAVLEGAARLEDLPPAAQSAIRLQIYHRACDVLTFTGNAAMAREIERQPETIREAVRAECRRLHELRTKGDKRN